jgi:hypothetical protein
MDKREKLPLWMQEHLKRNTNLATQDVVNASKVFLRDMAQPFTLVAKKFLTL